MKRRQEQEDLVEFQFGCTMANWLELRRVAVDTDRKIRTTLRAMVRLGLKRWVPSQPGESIGVLTMRGQRLRPQEAVLTVPQIQKVDELCRRERMTRPVAMNELIELGLVSRKGEDWKKYDDQSGS